MKGLDTNVLVRYLVQDDPKQASIAARVIEASATAGELMVIQPVVLAELVWVLETCYGHKRLAVSSVLEHIVRTSQFQIPERDSVLKALASYRRGKGDFADYLIGFANAHAGADSTLTFDRSLQPADGFELLR